MFVDALQWTIRLYGCVQLAYWIPSLLCLALDYSEMCLQQKLQPMPWSRMRHIYRTCVSRVALNIGVWSFVFIYAGVLCYDFAPRASFHAFHPIPELAKLLVSMLFLVDVLFALLHRLFHLHIFYRWHAKHHELSAPVAMAAAYASVPDFLFTNTLPLMLPVIALRMHWWTTLAWLMLALTSTTINAHGGWRGLGDMHDLHHRWPSVNYGVTGLTDRLLLGTYAKRLPRKQVGQLAVHVRQRKE